MNTSTLRNSNNYLNLFELVTSCCLLAWVKFAEMKEMNIDIPTTKRVKNIEINEYVKALDFKFARKWFKKRDSNERKELLKSNELRYVHIYYVMIKLMPII